MDSIRAFAVAIDSKQNIHETTSLVPSLPIKSIGTASGPFNEYGLAGASLLDGLWSELHFGVPDQQRVTLQRDLNPADFQFFC